MNQFSSLPAQAPESAVKSEPTSGIKAPNEPQSQISSKSSQQLLSQIYRIISSKSSKKTPLSLKRQSLSSSNEGSICKCKCKKTRCLKLYCQCFAQGEYCKDCNCMDCNNLREFEDIRAEAIDQALFRDPNAFDGKAKQRKGGCICKKTGCVKKYCECYSSGVPCTEDCKCLNCENHGGKDCPSRSKQRSNNENIEPVVCPITSNS